MFWCEKGKRWCSVWQCKRTECEFERSNYMSMMGELIKELRAYANVSLYAKEMEVRELLKKAAGTIEGLSAKVTKQNIEKSSQYYNGGWIPVEETLPRKAFGCIVTVLDTEPTTGIDYECILPYFVGYDGEQWNNSDGERIPFEVIAWQPLPPVYEPKED